jgi:flavin-dependent dehydrogenase
MESTERSSDVLVVGGGPAGLLLAGKLGVNLNVCLLERNIIGQTSKFWLTTEKRLARHGLLGAAQNQSSRTTIGTFQGSIACAEGDFTVVDDAALLTILKDKCLCASVRLIEKTKVLSVASQDQQLILQTTNGSYRTRLVIDASGGNSPFASTFRLHRLEGFYSIYGAHLDNLILASKDIVGAHIVHFGHPTPLFEVIPTGPTSAFCVVFLTSKDVVEPTKLHDMFQEHIEHNPFFKTQQSFKLDKPKMGVIPIGRSIKRRTIPGILPVGEAGMMQSPLLGAAFNEVLEYGDLIEEAVINAFSKSAQGIALPHVRFPIIKTINDRIQLMLAQHLLDGTLDTFEALVRFMKELGPACAYRLFCTQLNWADVPSAIKAAFSLLPLGLKKIANHIYD